MTLYCSQVAIYNYYSYMIAANRDKVSLMTHDITNEATQESSVVM